MSLASNAEPGRYPNSTRPQFKPFALGTYGLADQRRELLRLQDECGVSVLICLAAAWFMPVTPIGFRLAFALRAIQYIDRSLLRGLRHLRNRSENGACQRKVLAGELAVELRLIALVDMAAVWDGKSGQREGKTMAELLREIYPRCHGRIAAWIKELQNGMGDS